MAAATRVVGALGRYRDTLFITITQIVMIWGDIAELFSKALWLFSSSGRSGCSGRCRSWLSCSSSSSSSSSSRSSSSHSNSSSCSVRSSCFTSSSCSGGIVLLSATILAHSLLRLLGL